MVVFASDLNDVGEVRRLERQLSKSTGAIKRYNGRAEVRLSRLPQLRDGATMIPSLPKTKETKKGLCPNQQSPQPMETTTTAMIRRSRTGVHTIPFLNSSRGYFVPRHVIPPFHRVRNIERSKV
jgi:hypothetical protein